MDDIHLRQEYKGKKERTDYNERYEFWKAIERYTITIEVGTEDDGKLDMCKFKKIVRKKINTNTKSIKRFWGKKRTIKILVNNINKYLYEIIPQQKK